MRANDELATMFYSKIQDSDRCRLWGRRDFLKLAAWAAVLDVPFIGRIAEAAASGSDPYGLAEPFDYAKVKGLARSLAKGAYVPPPRLPSSALASLDWDRFQSIRPRLDRALWSGTRARFRTSFFHLGFSYREPVAMFETAGGRIRRIDYDPASFDYGKSGLGSAELPRDLGFAGFQLRFDRDFSRDIVAFLGASYFRAVGTELQYGISARGLAVDCALSGPEEFPIFRAFWLERPAPGTDRVVVHALLDSPSIAGAYRFEIRPTKSALLMDVDAALYPRKSIDRLGVAPLTSMFQVGENDRRVGGDWRPEIHDSDGLSLDMGSGEQIWRPLTNPSVIRTSFFRDDNLRGFGLMQRDRAFDHYQDDGVFYDLRPSLWVEPRAGFGKGSIELVELPTADETSDNIVAFFTPAERPEAGQELLYSYRLHWGSRVRADGALARVVATRVGAGGILGQKRRYYSVRFVVDFKGEALGRLSADASIEPVIVASRGEVELVSVRPLASVNGRRAMFDLKPTDVSLAPVELRLFLRRGSRTLSETWLYQWSPPPVAERSI